LRKAPQKFPQLRKTPQPKAATGEAGVMAQSRRCHLELPSRTTVRETTNLREVDLLQKQVVPSNRCSTHDSVQSHPLQQAFVPAQGDGPKLELALRGLRRAVTQKAVETALDQFL
jgi:hypothetical protein